MTIFRDLFKLSKKLSKALLENKGLEDLEASDLFSDDAKTHIKQHLSSEAIKENLELLNQIDRFSKNIKAIIIIKGFSILIRVE